MTRAAFRQADIERIFRAAKATGSVVQIDMRTLVMTVLPVVTEAPAATRNGLRYGSESWGDDDSSGKLPDDFAL